MRTYLEIRDPSALRPSNRRSPASVLRAMPTITAAESRALYAAVGRRWHWRDRDAWSDAQLAEWIARASVRTYRLDRPDGALLGYAELVRHEDDRCEIAYFGLVPEAMGVGHGGAFLTAIAREAWHFDIAGRGPVRAVWLHTCTLDAPQALPNYLARGFTVVRTEEYLTSG
ncbi:MAG: hypothetical protein MUF00_03075 [Gemmatimonadaceae bacterium]|nr:hypothetical protein [Gemmatimonadaceae bacterium]